jgi:hypothetical protein
VGPLSTGQPVFECKATFFKRTVAFKIESHENASPNSNKINIKKKKKTKLCAAFSVLA